VQVAVERGDLDQGTLAKCHAERLHGGFRLHRFQVLTRGPVCPAAHRFLQCGLPVEQAGRVMAGRRRLPHLTCHSTKLS
jgi:hypothetical protein